MPFVKGQVNNPRGNLLKGEFILKWNRIDKTLGEAEELIRGIINGTNQDLLALEKPKDRLDIQLEACKAIIRLAPQRHADADGSKLPVPIFGGKAE